MESEWSVELSEAFKVDMENEETKYVYEKIKPVDISDEGRFKHVFVKFSSKETN